MKNITHVLCLCLFCLNLVEGFCSGSARALPEPMSCCLPNHNGSTAKLLGDGYNDNDIEYSNAVASTGVITIKLDEARSTGGNINIQRTVSRAEYYCKVIILDMDGHVLFEKNYQRDGSPHLSIEPPNKLPTEIYALQVMEEGIAVATERMVVT
ncbi:MAG: hypothetical protein AAFZ15_26570 [Bacteroidota bacterium]